jgi:hypothetical protein
MRSPRDSVASASSASAPLSKAATSARAPGRPSGSSTRTMSAAPPVSTSMCCAPAPGRPARAHALRSAASGFRPWPSSLAARAFSHSRVVVAASAGGLAAARRASSAGQLGLGHQLLLVGFPGVEGQQRQSAAGSGLPASASASTAFTGRPPLRPQLQHASTCGASTSPGRRVISCRRGEQHHRRVAADLEARPSFCAPGRSPSTCTATKFFDSVGEVLPVEQRGLELVARRAPAGAPVQQHRLLLGARLAKARSMSASAAAGCQATLVEGRP